VWSTGSGRWRAWRQGPSLAVGITAAVDLLRLDLLLYQQQRGASLVLRPPAQAPRLSGPLPAAALRSVARGGPGELPAPSIMRMTPLASASLSDLVRSHAPAGVTVGSFGERVRPSSCPACSSTRRVTGSWANPNNAAYAARALSSTSASPGNKLLCSTNSPKSAIRAPAGTFSAVWASGSPYGPRTPPMRRRAISTPTRPPTAPQASTVAMTFVADGLADRPFAWVSN
jgi:hypothetical protein